MKFAIWLATLLGVITMVTAAAVNSSAVNSNAGKNPLLYSGAFPRWSDIKPSHVQPAVQQLIAEELASVELLEQDLARMSANITFDRLFKPLTQLRLRLDAVFGQIDHLSSVVDTPERRKAVDAITPSRVAFELHLGQSKPIYNAVKQLKDTSVIWQKLNPTQQRIVTITLKDYENSGVGLPEDKKKRFNAISDQLSQLTTNFSSNVLDSTMAFKLLVTNKSELDGLEETTLAVAAEKAKDAGHPSATAESGPWLLTLDYNTYVAVLSFAKNRDLRKNFYIAYRSIASSGKSDNTGIINQILALRKELAVILGYKNYAEEKFTYKMATFNSASSLMEQLINDSRAVAVEENAQVTQFARNVSEDKGLELKWWDIAYWSERQKEHLFHIKQERLREYLPLPLVIKGLFQLAHKLYGINVQLASGALPVWHKDVQVYAVSDANSTKPFAYFYADLFARPGSKQGGAWVQPLWDAAKYWRAPSPAAAAAKATKAAASNSTNSRTASVIWTPSLAKAESDWLNSAPYQLPIAVLISNQNPPAGGKPSLMSLNDAGTLFHEFGHALQHMLSKSKQGLTSGMRNIEWDAVETPSQMQEKWVYDKNMFNSIARHWNTNESVPSWMFDAIKSLKTYRQGNAFSYQLTLAMTDLILHSSYDPRGKVTPTQIQQQQSARIMPYKPYPGDRQLNNFGHIFGGGYAAGYYRWEPGAEGLGICDKPMLSTHLPWSLVVTDEIKRLRAYWCTGL
eukprot:GHRR01007314.1.p1 GENE.GHRR01007314.1~~GHRR01007314.1.p1  ORF type:complete len:740 (+),score=194.22 GHRR01007314.1:275-2494(+)